MDFFLIVNGRNGTVLVDREVYNIKSSRIFEDLASIYFHVLAMLSIAQICPKNRREIRGRNV